MAGALRCFRSGFEMLQVATGGEALAGAGDDDGPDRAVRLRGEKSVAQFEKHFVIEGVALIGPVERKGGDAAVVFNEDAGVGHEMSLQGAFPAILAGHAAARQAPSRAGNAAALQ